MTPLDDRISVRTAGPPVRFAYFSPTFWSPPASAGQRDWWLAWVSSWVCPAPRWIGLPRISRLRWCYWMPRWPLPYPWVAPFCPCSVAKIRGCRWWRDWPIFFSCAWVMWYAGIERIVLQGNPSIFPCRHCSTYFWSWAWRWATNKGKGVRVRFFPPGNFCICWAGFLLGGSGGISSELNSIGTFYEHMMKDDVR